MVSLIVPCRLESPECRAGPECGTPACFSRALAILSRNCNVLEATNRRNTASIIENHIFEVADVYSVVMVV